MGVNTLSNFGQPPAARNVLVNNNAQQQQALQFYGGALQFALKACQWMLIPAGNWIVQAGQYSNLQYWDQQSYLWRMLTGFDQVPYMLSADGTNYRICNTTGGAIGAIVTNKGSGFVNGFYGYNQQLAAVTIITGSITLGNAYLTATPSAGGSLWNMFVGGSINTSVTITNGGSNFTKAPTLIVVPPANQGAQPYIPATMTCTISAGAINAVTVVNQGAGYVSAPTVLIVNAPGDLTGAGAVLTVNATLANSGAVTAITCADPGTAAVTSVPTFTFGGTATIGALAATILPNLTIVSMTVSNAGVAYGNALPASFIAQAGNVTATPTNTNPAIEQGLILPPVQPYVNGAPAAGGTFTSAPTVQFQGYGFVTAPILKAIAGAGAIPSTDAQFTLTLGGAGDNIYLMAI